MLSIETYLQNKSLNPRTIAKHLNIKRSYVQFIIRNSNDIKRVLPLKMGSNKYDKTFNVFTSVAF